MRGKYNLEGTRVQVLAVTLAVWFGAITFPLCAWFPHFMMKTLDLISIFLQLKLPLPHTSEFTLLWWDAACQLWAELSLLAAPPLALIPSTPAASTYLGSPVSIRSLPPHSTGGWILDHSSWLVVYKMRGWPCFSFLVNICSLPSFNLHILATSLLTFNNYFHTPLDS